MRPFFSIVIPCYNRADMIGQAIRSVLGQTFPDFEIIIVDDGSTDNTENIVAQFADSRIRYFKKINEERSIARNFGIRRALGTYINFLDSDDCFEKNHLAVALGLIESNGYPEVVHLGFQIATPEGKILHRRNDFSNIENQIMRENILHGNAIFVRKELLIDCPFLDSRDAVISEDWYVWLRLMSRYTFLFSNQVTSTVFHHPYRSLNTIDPEKLMRSTELIVTQLKNDLRFNVKFAKKTRVFYADQFTFLTLILALNRKDRTAIMRYLLRAIWEDQRVVFRKRFLASIKYLLFPFLITRNV